MSGSLRSSWSGALITIVPPASPNSYSCPLGTLRSLMTVFVIEICLASAYGSKMLRTSSITSLGSN